MSQLNINDWPPEILTKIFRLLNAETLKNATLACKLWNNLIESGCRWSVRLNYNDLYFDEDRQRDFFRYEQKVNFMLTTKRRFGKIEISNARLSKDNRIFEIFRRQGFNIVELHLYKFRIDSRAGLAQLLKLTPNLESLDVKMLQIGNDVALDPVLPELKKLKILRMSQSAIVERLRNAKFTTIRIDENKDTETDFLSSQPTLTSLTIYNYNTCFNRSPLQGSILFQLGKMDVQIPFRLTKLGILESLGDVHSSQDHDNLVKFIESQSESLTEVELGWNLPISLYVCVLDSLSKLRTLIVSLDSLPMPMIHGFFDRLKENRSVCTIRLSNIYFNYPLLGEILRRLPNIRSVIIPESWITIEDKLAVMAQHLGRLESLFFPYVSFNGISFDNVKFGNLKTLFIGVLRAKINWNEFTKANPRLVELIVEKTYESRLSRRSLLTSDDIDKITTNVDLQYLRLGVGFVADDRFFEIIREKCKNLKELELHTSCVPQGLRHNVEINVLRLCEKINCPAWMFL